MGASASRWSGLFANANAAAQDQSIVGTVGICVFPVAVALAVHLSTTCETKVACMLPVGQHGSIRKRTYNKGNEFAGYVVSNVHMLVIAAVDYMKGYLEEA